MEKQFITLSNGEKLCYYEKGSGKQTILLLSGLAAPLPIADLFSLWEASSLQGRAIVLDRFGYGYSDLTQNSRNMKQVVAELKECCDLLKIQDNLVIIGHSLGSFNALLFAENYPNILKQIVLLDCYPFPNHVLWRWGQHLLATGIKGAQAIKAINTKPIMAPYLYALKKLGYPEHMVTLCKEFGLNRVYNQNVYDELKHLKGDIEEMLKDLANAKTVSILSICRTKTLSYSKKLQTQLPHVQIENLGKCSHMVHHDCKEKVIQLIQNVL